MARNQTMHPSTVAPGQRVQVEAAQRLSADDLATLMDSFQQVTEKLQRSHEQLTGQVSRLKRELSDANAALERSRRLAALGEMAAGIAHEIRNPLAAISLDAASLADEPDRALQQKAADRIQSAVKSLNAIVQDVLHFAGDSKPRPAEMDIEAVCARAVEECAGLADASVRLGPWAVEAVEADAHLLHRAIVNVVRNALEAMAERALDSSDGVARHEIGVQSKALPADEIAIVISDTGPGIPGEVIERMFNPFFTTRATGTGLGLAIVHRIMDAHGGRVEVEGQRTDGVGGARVILVLPRPGAATHSEAA